VEDDKEVLLNVRIGLKENMTANWN